MTPPVILFIAAERMEFDGLLRFVSSHPLDWGLQFACEGELNGSTAFFVAHGPGMQLAGFAADAVRQRVKPDLVISTGFCGALDPELNCGDILIATSVIDLESGRTYPARAPERGCSSAKTGAVVSSQRVAVSADEKKRLAQTGALAVEMEAGAIAWRAGIWGVPFCCIRAVSDEAGETLPIDFNRMRDAAGRFSRARIAAAALVRPWSGIPGLLRLGRGCRKASGSIGDFFANCRL
jgi:adenosylhomocysteine nucleosidase